MRILRYFRFYGRISEKPDAHEENTLRIISQNVSGLERISGERIWSELKKILQGNFAGELLNTMHHVGVTKYCGLPDKPDMIEFNNIWNRSKKLKLQPVTLLSAMLKTVDEAITLNNRLKMSAYDRDLTTYIIENRELIPDSKPLMPYKKLVIFSKRKSSEAREFVTEILKYQNNSLLEEFMKWEIPRFPVSGSTLRQNGVGSGRYMGLVMSELKKYWAEKEFLPDFDELVKEIPVVQSKLEDKKNK